MAGGHNLLLEWALRESRSGIAAFLDGALDGLNRAAAGECVAAANAYSGGLWLECRLGRCTIQQGTVGFDQWARRTRGLVMWTAPAPSMT